MPTNANTFNSRVTSEALEAKFRQAFPSQGGAELPQDLFASGVIQPVVDFSNVATGSLLPQDLNNAWDFSTINSVQRNSSAVIASNAGFWKVQCTITLETSTGDDCGLSISDGLSSKDIFEVNLVTANFLAVQAPSSFIVFLRSGDSLSAFSNGNGAIITANARQIADVYGNPTVPLGYVPQ